MQKWLPVIVEIDLQIAGKVQGRRFDIVQLTDDVCEDWIDHCALNSGNDRVRIACKIADFPPCEMEPDALSEAIQGPCRRRNGVIAWFDRIEMGDFKDFAAQCFGFEFEREFGLRVAESAAVALARNRAGIVLIAKRRGLIAGDSTASAKSAFFGNHFGLSGFARQCASRKKDFFVVVCDALAAFGQTYDLIGYAAQCMYPGLGIVSELRGIM